MKCLEKRASDRPQQAGELVHALDDMATPSGGLAPTTVAGTLARPRALLLATVAVAVIGGLAFGYRAMSRAQGADTAVRTMAVLPFENRSRDSTYDYLADGISDELRSALNGVSGLGVKARSSSAALRGKSARDAGAKLDVAAVLEGSLSRSGERIRVTAELVRVADENTMWSGSFDRESKDLPAVQDSIIRAIRATLRIGQDGSTGSASGVAGARGTTDFEAYDLFMNGEYFRRRFDLPRAILFFTAAVAKDSNFARAHASLAATYATLPFLGVMLGGDAHERASRSVDRALALAPSLPAARAAQAQLYINDFRYADAERALQQAVALDSTDAESRVWHANALGNLGRIDEALAEAGNAVRLDPLATDGRLIVAYAHMYQKDFRRSEAGLRSVLVVDPKSAVAWANLAETYALDGQADSAVAAIKTALGIDAKSFGMRYQAMFVFAIAGRWMEADEQRRLAVQEGGNSPNFTAAVIGLVYGNFEAAMLATERGLRAREPLFNTYWVSCDPMFIPLRSQARFVALMKERGATMCAADDRWPIRPRQ